MVEEKIPSSSNSDLITQHCHFLGTKNIMITIVRPVVRSTSEVTIAEVLEDRFIHELKDENNAKTRAEELAKKYRGAELPRCRLKATLSHMGTIVSYGVSYEDIVDKVSFLNLSRKKSKK